VEQTDVVMILLLGFKILHKIDIVILTERRYVSQNTSEQYTNNVYKEDQLVQDALNELGIKTLRISSDYFNRFQEFSKWLSKVTKQTLFVKLKRNYSLEY
jgi:hypothetical protein